MKTLLGVSFFLIVNSIIAQPVKAKLDAAIKKLEADSQMKHAIIGFCVVDTKTGLPVYEHNSQAGLAPASTQKLFTSGAAFELLGKDYRYKTQLGYYGEIKNGILDGNISILGSGDPTFGSWRFKETNDSVMLNRVTDAVKKLGIIKINGGIWIQEKYLITSTDQPKEWSYQFLPGGWIWDDIGNYYGAGANYINWRENQYDVVFYPGSKVGERVDSLEIIPRWTNGFIRNNVVTGPKGSGDNAYIYFNPGTNGGTIQGSIPAGEKKFTISGAIPDASSFLKDQLTSAFVKKGIGVQKDLVLDTNTLENHFHPRPNPITVVESPPLDSINYWFLKKSINLYGEALIKTIASEDGNTKIISTETGAELVRNFWSQHGIEKSAIHIIDGSGLSPQNRVTTDALVKVLQYAKTRPWYNSFYYALPEYNGMKMKSGSISGSRAFAGYQVSKDGHEYSFAIIINNYDGSSSQAVKKMYSVLDVLK